MGELYRLDFSNGKSYIGMTTKNARARFIGHAKATRLGGKLLIHKAWRKYGKPRLIVLGNFSDAALAKAEIAAIKSAKTLSPFGYNLSFGGEISPMKNPDVALKVSRAKKGNVVISQAQRALYSKLFTGRKTSKATRARLSIAMRKRYENPAERKRTGDFSRGKTISEKQKRQISRANSGKGNGNFGRKFSAKTRANMSASAKIRCASPKERARLKSIAGHGKGRAPGFKHSEKTKSRMRATWAKKRVAK